MLNLWSWRDAQGGSHVGVSDGPLLDQVLDLSAVESGLHSVNGLWQVHGGGEALSTFLRDALGSTRERVALRPETLSLPVDLTECWAAGVTYQMSRDARVEETQGGEDFYRKVYEAERPELFFKSPGSRVVGPYGEVGLRQDSTWQIPEPELTLIVDPDGHLFGYTAGNDMSCRDIEGENPLYLPQAKIYHHSAAVGPCIALADTLDAADLEISLQIQRRERIVFAGSVNTRMMRRTPDELIRYLRRAWPMTGWTALMTGTAVVPPADFTLEPGDTIDIAISGIGHLVTQARRITSDWASVPQ
ncbi:fumarylacetoacetate hydrolase family protein [Sulfobacillus harzensis]|uniref:Fumarylacetoacetase-like C-terminal domain-containing protein n=1 Tax=Sulfobacillus harzensis TaxID=2729629 RepID=A0A7Y0L2U6_9FIRM|nr:fumarylacetoacetate hydrolase family protein [Sulfobacillus harzensis]NMP21375.1 hypothetical protein [Sulfobacillus harzensis]